MILSGVRELSFFTRRGAVCLWGRPNFFWGSLRGEASFLTMVKGGPEIIGDDSSQIEASTPCKNDTSLSSIGSGMHADYSSILTCLGLFQSLLERFSVYYFPCKQSM